MKMEMIDDNTLISTSVEHSENTDGLKITRKFSDDGFEIVRIIHFH